MGRELKLNQAKSRKLYKYVGASYLDGVLSNSDSVSLKCSYPREYNDPYELFLTIPFDVEPDLLAYYAEVIGEMDQVPTTCFSRSPEIVPMWAHYGQGHRGVVLELDQAALSTRFPKNGFGDVVYKDGADPSMAEVLERAFTTKKPRHTYFLARWVFSAAYYSKARAWTYEQETRMVVDASSLVRRGKHLLLDVPNEYVTGLIAGSRSSEKTRQALKQRADATGAGFYVMRVGRTSPKPFFVDTEDAPFIFDGESLREPVAVCASCGEPMVKSADECSWCRIDEDHRFAAASSNPFRKLDSVGMLESYLEDMAAIDRRHSKNR